MEDWKKNYTKVEEDGWLRTQDSLNGEKKGKRWMESMYHNIYILYTLLYIGAYNINNNTLSYFKKTK